jgi:hypothetical protein
VTFQKNKDRRKKYITTKTTPRSTYPVPSIKKIERHTVPAASMETRLESAGGNLNTGGGIPRWCRALAGSTEISRAPDHLHRAAASARGVTEPNVLPPRAAPGRRPARGRAPPQTPSSAAQAGHAAPKSSAGRAAPNRWPTLTCIASPSSRTLCPHRLHIFPESP